MADKCTACQLEVDTVRVRERRPGSLGTMAQSFWGDYRLCQPCIARAAAAKCVESHQEKSKKPRREERYIVLAHTLFWLKQVK